MEGLWEGSGEGFGKVLGGSASLSGAAGSSHGCFVLFFVIFCVFSVVSCFFFVFSFSSCTRATAQDTVCLAREPRLTLFGITLSVPRTWSRNAFIAAVSTFLHQQASCLLPFTPSHMSKEGRRYVRSTGNCMRNLILTSKIV